MFIEVYKIPTNMWTNPASESKIPENRKLVSVGQIKDVDYSHHCEGRAEIEYIDGKKATVVGSYEEIVARVTEAVETGKVQRV
jgi:hypothetical protein